MPARSVGVSRPVLVEVSGRHLNHSVSRANDVEALKFNLNSIPPAAQQQTNWGSLQLSDLFAAVLGFRARGCSCKTQGRLPAR